MKQSHAMAYLRQLCCSGLGQDAVMPEFLKAVQTVIPSANNVYTPVNEAGFPVAAITEVCVPDIIEIAQEIVPKFFTAYVRSKSDQILKNKLIIDNPKIFADNFFQTDLYHLIWRPSEQHHMLCSLVFKDGNLAGRLFLYRPALTKPFSQSDQKIFSQLLPYVSHALHENKMDDVQFIDSGHSCLLISDIEGKIIYLSKQAKSLLTLVMHSNFRFDYQPTQVLPLMLIEIIRNLNRIAKGQAAPAPCLTVTNTAGRFNLRAYWLDKLNQEPGALVGITIEHQEPLALKILRVMQDLPLSPTQREVALLLAQGVSTDKIGNRLRIRYTTVKDHIRKIFDKLDIHQREELLPMLLALDKLHQSQ